MWGRGGGGENGEGWSLIKDQNRSRPFLGANQRIKVTSKLLNQWIKNEQLQFDL